MTEVAEPYVATESERMIRSQSIRGRVERTPPKRAPEGRAHAARRGEDVTLCGLRVADLHPFEDIPWSRKYMGMEPCQECEEALSS
jgi:hypothetical protein